MVRGTNKDLASHSVENSNTIQYKRKDWKHNGKHSQTSLQADDDEVPPGLESTLLFDLIPNTPKERHRLILD